MANKEAPNTLQSNATFRVLDAPVQGPIAGFMAKPGPYGTDPLCSTFYDDVPVRNPDGSYNFNITGAGYAFNYTLGYSDQTGITGFQKVEAVIPLSSNTRVANPPEGAGPVKNVIASFSSNTYPDADAVKVTVRVPALFAQDNEGNTNPYQIDYAVDISINNGQFLPVGTHTIAGKCTSDYQRTTVYQLPKTTPPSAYYEWKVRVRRVSQNILSIRTQNELFVDSIVVVSTSLYAYPNTVLVGTQINADQFSSIPARAYELKGLLVSVPSGYTPTQYGFDTASFTRQAGVDAGIRHIVFNTQEESQGQGINAGMRVSGAGIPDPTYVVSLSQEAPWLFTVDRDPTATSASTTLTFFPTAGEESITPASYPAIWDGTWTTGVWTDNPAWIFYDLLTDPVHGLGDYIQAGSVDKWTLYKIAQYCDAMVDDGEGGLEPRFTANVLISQPEQAYTTLLNLASTFRGMLYYANGTIHASQQQDEPPVFAFNNANVVGGAFSYSDTARDTRATVAKVKWIDPKNGYRENIAYVEDIDGILRYGYREKEMTAFACTSYGQAYRLGSWTLESERLLTETVTFQTDLEGVALRPGDNFAVYDNFRTNRAQAGRVVGFTTGRSLVTLDRSVALEPGQQYSLSCIVPKVQLDGSGDVTGSSQISLIRQSQVESFAVVTSPTSGTTQLVIAGSFSSGLYVGSPFILAASGTGAPILTQASFYTCLATAEVSPGVIEVLGLQANTGVQFSIQTGYTVVDWPTNPGDIDTSILPPSNLRVTGVTGITAPDNTFYCNVDLTWVNSPSANLSYYVVSGKEWDTDYERFTVIGTGFTFPRNDTGQYLFRVAAVSLGGVESPFITGGLLVSEKNPLGTLRPLSGVRLTENGDPLYVNASTGYTGFVGINPGFTWTIPVDENGVQIVDAQFISGYRWAARSFNGTTGYLTGYVSGAQNTTYQFTGDLLRGFAGAPRGFDFVVETVDIYGNVAPGGSIKVNNPPMKPPFASGFVGYNGGISYNVTPSLQYDTSGIYLWVDQSPSFTPTFSNYDFVSTNLAGVASIAPNTGSFYTWFALSDTFAKEGNPIFGPISGSANQMFDTFDLDITAEINEALNTISGSFALLTGQVTNSLIVISGQNQLTLQQVQGLSGEVTGLPGVVNTALNVRVNTAVVNSSGSLSQQIDAVRAQTQTTGALLTAQVGAVSTALTNSGVALGSRIDVVTANYQAADNALSTRVTATGATLLSSMATADGALAQWITNLGAQTSGQNSSVQVGARAFVTGDVNGIGGAAVATWGFKLNANGKVVSMQATSEDVFGHPSEFGTIVFGNANLQSDTFSAGSVGWQISANGNAEFNNASVRGAFTGGAGSSQAIVDADGFRVGNMSQDRVVIGASSNKGIINCYSPDNVVVAALGYGGGAGIFPGVLNLYPDGGGAAGIILLGQGTSTIGTNLDVNGLLTVNGEALIAGSDKLYFWNTSNGTYIQEENGINLWGDSSHPVRIRNAALLLNESAAGSFTAGRVYDLNGDQILRDRYAGTPTTLADVIAVLQHHGLSN